MSVHGTQGIIILAKQNPFHYRVQYVHYSLLHISAGMVIYFLLYFQVTTQAFLEAVTLKHKIKNGPLYVD